MDDADFKSRNCFFFFLIAQTACWGEGEKVPIYSNVQYPEKGSFFFAKKSTQQKRCIFARYSVFFKKKKLKKYCHVRTVVLVLSVLQIKAQRKAFSPIFFFSGVNWHISGGLLFPLKKMAKNIGKFGLSGKAQIDGRADERNKKKRRVWQVFPPQSIWKLVSRLLNSGCIFGSSFVSKGRRARRRWCFFDPFVSKWRDSPFSPPLSPFFFSPKLIEILWIEPSSTPFSHSKEQGLQKQHQEDLAWIFFSTKKSGPRREKLWQL